MRENLDSDTNVNGDENRCARKGARAQKPAAKPKDDNERPDSVAGVSVQIAPCSVPAFPANREYVREIHKIAILGAPETVNERVVTERSMPIPY